MVCALNESYAIVLDCRHVTHIASPCEKFFNQPFHFHFASLLDFVFVCRFTVKRKILFQQPKKKCIIYCYGDVK